MKSAVLTSAARRALERMGNDEVRRFYIRVDDDKPTGITGKTSVGTLIQQLPALAREIGQKGSIGQPSHIQVMRGNQPHPRAELGLTASKTAISKITSILGDALGRPVTLSCHPTRTTNALVV